MQGYGNPEQLPMADVKEGDAIRQKHAQLEDPPMLPMAKVTDAHAEGEAFSANIMLPQPGPEPSPLFQARPQRDSSVSEASLGAPELSSSDSEPASEPSATSHQTIPEALFRTNLASLRFRRSPYFEATLRWGVKAFQPYNHVLLPQLYSTEEDECENLRKNVCLWDVTCQQQIEVKGEDACELCELLTPRIVGSMKVGEARYCPMTDEEGMVINDPVLFKVEENRYWFSIADQDMLWWVKGIALGRGLKVKVSQPDVSTLAVQGPKSLPLMKELFGDWIEELKYFHFRQTDLDGIPMLVSRSGWSPERGYELLVMDGSRGDELWEKVMAAGQKYGIKPGRPNLIRRVEGGMLSFGIDVTTQHNVLELGLPPKWCSADKPADCLGKAAIKALMESGGPKKKIVGIELNKSELGDRNLGPMMKPWDILAPDAEGNDVVVGKVTSLTFSPVMDTHIAIATLATDVCDAGTQVRVETASRGLRGAVVRKLPFMPRVG